MSVVISHGLFGHTHFQIGVGPGLQKTSSSSHVVQARGAMQLCPAEFPVFDYLIHIHGERVPKTRRVRP